MGIGNHMEHFAGLPVRDFDPEEGIADPTGVAYRIRESDFEAEDFFERLQAFLGDPRVGQVPALLIGVWSSEVDDDSSVLIDELVENRENLKALRSLFLGDIIYEECEISWISH